MLYTLIFLLGICITIISCFLPPSRKFSPSYIFLILFFLVLVLVSSQYSSPSVFISGEHSGHYDEMVFCNGYNQFLYFEPAKSIIKYLACSLQLPGLFDFSYKLLFVCFAIFNLYLSSPRSFLNYKPNPWIPILFTSYPMLYGNVRSSLCAFSISFCYYLIFNLYFFFADKPPRKYLFLGLFALFPFLFHPSGMFFIVFLFLLPIFSGLLRILRLYISLKFLLLGSLLCLFSSFIFIILGSADAVILGKSLSFYFQKEFDVSSFGLIAVSTFTVFSAPMFLRLTSYLFFTRRPTFKFRTFESSVTRNFDISYLSILLLSLVVSASVSVQVSARCFALFYPLIYSLYSSHLSDNNFSLSRSFLFSLLLVSVYYTLAYSEIYSGQYGFIGLPQFTSIF